MSAINITMELSAPPRPSERLVGFLRLVESEELEGRCALIRGKPTALDVYGYTSAEVEKKKARCRLVTDSGDLTPQHLHQF